MGKGQPRWPQWEQPSRAQEFANDVKNRLAEARKAREEKIAKAEAIGRKPRR